jgi:uncharacterized protein (TIGR03435 family)
MVPIAFLLTGFLAQQNSFEVASFRLARENSGPPRFLTAVPGKITLQHVDLKFLVARSYDVDYARVALGEQWMESLRYDLNAIYPVEATERVPEMIRTLLEERLVLKTHRYQKETPGYQLVVAPGGPKLKEAADASLKGTGQAMDGRFAGQSVQLPSLARSIGLLLQQPVWDVTGLNGRYDIQLKWTPDASAAIEPGPSLFSAIKEQLGLTLKPHKEVLDYIVVDGAKREPIEN